MTTTIAIRAAARDTTFPVCFLCEKNIDWLNDLQFTSGFENSTVIQGETVVSRITDLFGGVQKYCNLPVLPWKSHFSLGNDRPPEARAIDIPPESLGSNIVMRGETPEGRPFVTIKTESTPPYSDFPCTPCRGYLFLRSQGQTITRVATLFPNVYGDVTSLFYTNHAYPREDKDHAWCSVYNQRRFPYEYKTLPEGLEQKPVIPRVIPPNRVALIKGDGIPWVTPPKS